MKKGFTLIELLVVISIISLLASILLASLSASRLKAGESAIKSQLKSIGSQAELYYATAGNSSYGTPHALSTPNTPPPCPPGGLSMFALSSAAGGLRDQIIALESVSGSHPSCASASFPSGGVTNSWAVSTWLADLQNTYCIETGGRLAVGVPGSYYPVATLSSENEAGCFYYPVVPDDIGVGGGIEIQDEPLDGGDIIIP